MRLLIAASAALVAISTLTAASRPAAAQSTVTRTTVGTHTVQRVVRPVHRDGTPTDGWRVRRQRLVGFTCNEGPSRVAVDPNIRICGQAITNTVACWKSTGHTALCMRNPRLHQLVRIRYVGSFRPVRPPSHPSPQALNLRTGNRCIIRSGGAWDLVRHHPHWLGTYSCARSNIYGRGRDGIDRTVNPWRVHLVLNPRKPIIRDRRVATAFFAGTAP